MTRQTDLPRDGASRLAPRARRSGRRASGSWLGCISIGSPLVALVAVALLGSACASRGTPPRFPGAIRPPQPSSPGAQSIGETARRLEGTPYRNGGSDLSGFDCSGLVQYVFARHGVALPRSVRDQFQSGLAVPRSSLVAGDLVFFSTTAPGATHVGIIVDGKDGSFVHAPSERGVVRVERLSADYWTRRYIGARRILLAPSQNPDH
jgi:cell wall-associated NlpC family hydrolase